MNIAADISPGDTASLVSSKPTREDNDFRDTFVVFDLCDQSFGVEVKFVREIIDLSAIRRIPTPRPDIDGVVDIRGESIPIIDISSLLNLHMHGQDDATRIIVFEIEDGDTVVPVGVLADRVRDVVQIPHSAVEDPPGMLSGGGSGAFLLGIARLGEQFIMLVDIFGIISPKVSSSSLDMF
ncbi:MAG: chemotaxis protein CheW [Pseudomonadota bacterium]